MKLDVKTVRRAICRSPSPVRVSPPRPSALDPWRERITQWLREEPKVTAKRIRRLLLPLTRPVPARTVRRYVAGLRAGVAPKEAFVHRSVQAGTTMEVDFGESWVDIAGVPRKVKYLVATLPFSNAYFAKAYAVERLESLLDGIESAFRWFGGVVDHRGAGGEPADASPRRPGARSKKALAVERQHLRAMPVHLPATCRVVTRVADKFGHVRVDKVTYSVPIRHAYRPVWVLRLSTVAAQWQPLAEQAVRERQTPADYLAQLMHLEVTARRERRIQRRIQDARFPMLKTLDTFSFEAQPDLDRDPVLQVFDLRFVAEAANVLFVGGVGTGKTHLSIALGMTCCQHDYRVRFVTAAELVTMRVEAQQQGGLVDLLLGFISQRYERRSLVAVTTNLPFARWSEVFLDPTAADAVIDLMWRPLSTRQPREGCAGRTTGRNLPPALPRSPVPWDRRLAAPAVPRDGSRCASCAVAGSKTPCRFQADRTSRLVSVSR